MKLLKPKLGMNIPETRGHKEAHSPVSCVGDRGQADPGSVAVRPEPLSLPVRWY